ncbi:hypothetical protein [Paenibacillus sp. A14]|uniref:hypothetical protein n=1 Tax=Paenibacillus sp. A14 TaxID=3119820 RepID=UPI002FE13B77
MNSQEKKELAFRIYPLPHGTSYRYTDLLQPETVEILFDYCQIMEAVIYKEGWEMLLNYHGLETLYMLNRKSEWFDCNSKEELLRYIEAYIEDTASRGQLS